MTEFLAVAVAIVIYLLIDGCMFTPPPTSREDYIRNHSLYQTLRSKYPYMSDEDIDKMVRKTLRIK